MTGPASTGATPFPWHALRRVARDEARAVRVLRARFPAFAARLLERRLRELVATRVEVHPRGRALHPTAPAPRSTRLLLETDAGLFRVAVEVDPALVLAVVGLLSGGKTLPRVAVGPDVPPEVAGAAVGVLEWLGHGAGVELGPAPGPPRGCVLVLDAVVEIGALRGRVRLIAEVPDGEVAPDEARILERLGETPLGVRVVAHAGTAAAGLLARLGVGDVLLVPPAPSVRVGRRAFEATILAPEGGFQRVRVGQPSPALAAAPPPSEEGSPMSANDESGATVEMAALGASGTGASATGAPELAQALAELPLEVQVELGTATMTARAWSSFALGDVLVLDQRVGAPVGLRVSGRLIGRGELVEVDGSVGVRITERMG